VTLHLQHTPHLLQVDVLPPPQTDHLVPSTQDLKRNPPHIDLPDCSSPSARSELRDDTSSKRESTEVEEDVGLGVGDEEDVEVFQGSVDESHAVGFEDRVLRRGRDEAGEGGEERFEARAGEAEELTREEG
jgi:hypothetical protein